MTRWWSGLQEFISYLIRDRQGKKVYYENGNVYDKHYALLNKVELLVNGQNLNVVKEILLSGAGEIEIVTPLPTLDEKYVTKFFEGKIRFAKDYYS